MSVDAVNTFRYICRSRHVLWRPFACSYPVFPQVKAEFEPDSIPGSSTSEGPDLENQVRAFF